MFKKIKIQNFKAFGPDTPPIDLAPITLIFGQNSAGKSSILQALNLLKQTQESEGRDTALLPRGNILDLGSFKEFAHDHNEDAEIRLGLSVEPPSNKLSSRREYLIPHAKGIQYNIRLDKDTREIKFYEMHLMRADLDTPLLSIKLQEASKEHLRRMRGISQRHLLDEQIGLHGTRPLVATTKSISMEEDVWRELHGHCKRDRIEILARLESRLESVMAQVASSEELQEMKLRVEKEFNLLRESDANNSPDRRERNIKRDEDIHHWKLEHIQFRLFRLNQEIERRFLSEDNPFKEEPRGTRIGRDKRYIGDNFSSQISSTREESDLEIQRLKHAIEFYSQDFTLKEFIERVAPEAKGQQGVTERLLVTTPLRSKKRRTLPEFDLEDYRSMRQGVTGHTPFDGIGAIRSTAKVTREVVYGLGQMFPLGPFRQPAARRYTFGGSSPKDVGFSGDQLPDLLYRNPKILERANEWLKRLQIGYSLDVRTTDSDDFEVRLLDARRSDKVEVSLADVGFGISQILPFIVQSLASTGRVISIEQPEVHIHPGLQADLGDLITESIKPPFDHQYLIETHSEHLILRMLKLVRKGGLKAGDLCVLYVERMEEGSQVRRIEVDEDGDFITEWPGGFFPERRKELF